MVHIKNTNFIVDDFRFSKRSKLFNNFIYFLSHMHGDHYRGISNSFDNSKIFCTKETGILLSLKFPGIKSQIIPMECNKPYTIVMNE